MKTNPTILSSKKLSYSQKELLLNSGIGFVEYDAIEIEFLNVTIDQHIHNAIFTSKNAVKAVLNSGLAIQQCFCVGDNTKKLLQQGGIEVIETAQNARDLAEIIVRNYQQEKFHFICGNLRRDELPSILSQNKISLEEIIIYNTLKKSTKIDRVFDGILFFSPSGIESYTSENVIKESMVFCIGNTTASEAKKHTDNIIIANKPTVENVIVQAVKYFDKRI